MKFLGWELRREQRNVQDPTIPVSSSDFLAYFGVAKGNLAPVTIDNALTVPAFLAGVSFLAGSMANLPLHVFRDADGNAERSKGPLQRILNEAPNDELTSYGWRKYTWQQVFTGGRGLSWIERSGSNIVAIWPMDPAKVVIERSGGRTTYTFEGRKTYPASDVIDIPFMLKADGLKSYSPVVLGSKAIQLAIAMGDYAADFFAGGGVPPLALEGPLPQGPEAFKRAMDDIRRAVNQAKESDTPFFGMPPGHKLTPIGFDPEKGQMTDARRFQVEEFARILGLPPVFLQDLTHGTFSNTEQQDLHLVKHRLAGLAKQFEEELNLKLFGAKRNVRFVEHNMDGVMRGDFKSRIEGLARGVQSAILTPNEARALENRPAKPKGDDLYVQGATVKLGQEPKPEPAPAAAEPDDGAADDDGA